MGKGPSFRIFYVNVSCMRAILYADGEVGCDIV